MDKLILAFPENIGEALEIASKSEFRIPKNEIRNILICGMGGSGIGGRMVAMWFADQLKVPVQIVHDYTLPEYVNENTLVIGSSYSGNTEETLVAINQAHIKKAHIIGVCSGGELKDFCSNNDYDYVVVPGGNPPRTALAYSIIQLTNILVRLGMISKVNLDHFSSAKELIENKLDVIQFEAKKLANFIKGTVPVFYAGAKYEAIAIRARQQFNENAKMLCWHHVIPEMNHNELVGWGGGDSRFSAVFFNTFDLIRRNEKRAEITHDHIQEKTKVLIVNADGNNFIERSIFIIHLVDWSSYYLSELKGVDSIDIEVIDYLKNELANFH